MPSAYGSGWDMPKMDRLTLYSQLRGRFHLFLRGRGTPCRPGTDLLRSSVRPLWDVDVAHEENYMLRAIAGGRGGGRRDRGGKTERVETGREKQFEKGGREKKSEREYNGG